MDALTPAPASFSNVEAWARHYITTTDLAHKCVPGTPPRNFDPRAETLDLRPPGRPSELRVTRARPRSLSQAAMLDPKNRAKLLHKFWHHELQAAELMCWALLAYADAEPEFRVGLLGICQDEIRHMAMYQRHVEALGFRIGDFLVRDWFWERVPTCRSKLQFVALLGMGLEAANLDHTPRFAAWFDHVGDHTGARLQEQVGREEVAHVRFAVRWFRRWTGGCDFERWTGSLPEPLSPLLMRGKSINRAARFKAEMGEAFVDALMDWRAP